MHGSLRRPTFEPPPAGALDPGAGVDVWRVRLDAGPDRLARLRALLDPDESRRAGAISDLRLRRRFEVRQGVLREILSRYRDVAPASHAFERERGGRPRRVGGPDFNLSDSQDLALVAVAAVGRVGIDLERLREVGDPEALARRWLPEAVARVGGGTGSSALLGRWTRWEAALKSEGCGVLDPRRHDPVLARRAVEALSFEPAPGFVAALWPPGPSVRWWEAP